MDTFIGIMRDIESSLNIRTMTFEYEIVACFFDHDALTSHELSTLSRCSHSAFSNILRRLEGRQVICSETNPADKRSRIYRLSDKISNYVGKDRGEYNAKNFDEWRESNRNSHFLRIYSSNVRKAIGIRHLTCEYQILLNLYYRSGITNMEFTDIIESSLTKFNRSLRTLSETGLIYSEKDSRDKRIKRYSISDLAKETIEGAYQRLYFWAHAKPLLTQRANALP